MTSSFEDTSWHAVEDDKEFMKGARAQAEALFRLGELDVSKYGSAIIRLMAMLEEARAVPHGADFQEKIMAENRAHVLAAEQRRAEVATELRNTRQLKERIAELEAELDAKDKTAKDCDGVLRENVADIKRAIDGGKITDPAGISAMLEATLEANPCLRSERVAFNTRTYGPARMPLATIMTLSGQRRPDEMWWTDELVHDLSTHLCQELAASSENLESVVTEYLAGVAKEYRQLDASQLEYKFGDKGIVISTSTRYGHTVSKPQPDIRRAMASLVQELPR